MLTTPLGLSADDLAAVAALEQAVLAVDGGRLKLEHPELARRRGDRAEDVLATADGELVGFVGLYTFGQPTVELAGMVSPAHRRRGLGTAMVREALALARRNGCARALLVTSGGPGAAAFAASVGGTPHHSEHALLLDADPGDGPEDPTLTVRPAGPPDTEAVLGLLTAAFGANHGPDRVPEPTPAETTLLVERAGVPVATLRRDLVGPRGAVYGFAVDPAQQGRGTGRDVLRRVCRGLRADGATEVALEVEVANVRALGLYTSLGFRRVATEEYFTLPLP